MTNHPWCMPSGQPVLRLWMPSFQLFAHPTGTLLSRQVTSRRIFTQLLCTEYEYGLNYGRIQ